MVKVNEIMQKQAVICSSSMSVLDAAKLMRSHNVDAVTVVDDGRPVGIFTEADLLKRVVAEGLNVKKTRIQSVMTRDPVCISPDEDVEEVNKILEFSKFKHLPVVNVSGSIIGMISLKNLVRFAKIKGLG